MSTVVVCLSEEIKSMVYASVEASKMKEAIKNAVYEELDRLPDCEGELSIDFGVEGRKGKAPKKKRAMSAYNLFVSDCVTREKAGSFKEGGQRMAKCAKEWNKGGEKLKKEYEGKLAELKNIEAPG